MKGNIRTLLVRGAQIVLGLDGILHLAAFGSAVMEDAWVTAGITAVQCVAFFFGIYFIGHDHTHHQEDEHHHDEEGDA
ncbi:MAG: hypothetical protein OSB32_04280 [Candidatus Poseidoniales archaeon]|mgnify:CR=1 FL=1|nr:hypothetical protein [Candidatus Poseidoniales archaeon]